MIKSSYPVYLAIYNSIKIRWDKIEFIYIGQESKKSSLSTVMNEFLHLYIIFTMYI